MEKREMRETLLCNFETYLWESEKSRATIKKYMRDIRQFADYVGESMVDRSMVLSFKLSLEERYALTSANSMLAALNAFLCFAGWNDLCVKQFRVQKKVYSPEEKELTKDEYYRLIRTALKNGNERLALIIQTICGTGMRVSELEYITVDAAQRGEAFVACKAKARTVFIVSALQKKLLTYAKENGITEGTIFVTRNGKPMDRSNIWKEMKTLCQQAEVSTEKVFPHNLRHLFARTFYGMDKDLAKLADILGHSNINTTRIYIITTGAEHRRRMESMKLIV